MELFSYDNVAIILILPNSWEYNDPPRYELYRTDSELLILLTSRV